MGYVGFPLTKIARLNTLSSEPLLKLNLEGDFHVQYIGEAFDAYREYLFEIRKRCHGMACFEFGDRVAPIKTCYGSVRQFSMAWSKVL